MLLSRQKVCLYLRTLIDQKSIAVLPFENLSSDPENEYFSDGMTEEIINALTRIEGLKVTARTSAFVFKGVKEDIRIIGNKLGVASVLEGSIRKSGNRVRITAQLIRTDNGFHLWSESFDRELSDIFALQDEISLLIADKIREDFGHMEIQEQLVDAKTQNQQAYEVYLKGVHHFKRKDLEDITSALALFEESARLDPLFSEAWAYIAETYMHYTGFNLINPVEGMTLAREMAQKALEINPKEPRAHKALAFIHLFYDRHWKEAITSYNQAITHGYQADNDFVSYYYIFIEKDYELAIKVARQSVDRDPLHAITHWQLGLCYYFAQQFEPALQAFEQSLKLDPEYGEALRWKGLVLGYLGRFEEGLTLIDQALEITNHGELAVLDRFAVRILSGETGGIVDEIAAGTYMDPCDPARLYSIMDRPDLAIDCLKKGIAENSMMLVTLKHWWVWDNIREADGSQEIYDQLNFTEHKSHKADDQSALLVTPSHNSLSEKEITQILGWLQEQIKHPPVVMDHNLTLRTLADRMGVHPNKLSWVLNEKVGKNFNEYINELRLDIFQQKALDPANSHLSILGLAYESGFTSKTVFNNFFKKKMGVTPKQWLKRQ